MCFAWWLIARFVVVIVEKGSKPVFLNPDAASVFSFVHKPLNSDCIKTVGRFS